MLALLAVLLVFALVAVVPVMIGARMVGANNTGFGSALFGVIMLAFLSGAVKLFGFSDVLAFVVGAGVGGLLLSAILGTTFWRALGVSVIATAIQVGAIVLFAGAALLTR